jgi:DNA methylase
MSQQLTDESLLREESVPQAPVECLGMMFENDEARRSYFLAMLREGLEELHSKLSGVPYTSAEDTVAHMQSIEKWPMGDEARVLQMVERMRHAVSGKDLLQRWKSEIGFPHGEIENILRLSNPPYYTACPNPFIQDFIKHYGKPYYPNHDDYRREPFAADVSEGKNDPIYNAHSYHTKVPHKAIMRYILHYTQPADIIFDGFCGTGMTGVAAELCGDKKTVESLGYRVLDNGMIIEEDGKPLSSLGARQTVLIDLSPAATFIACNYNRTVDINTFTTAANELITRLDDELGWMYSTSSQPEGLDALINYTVWSDVFLCPHCASEVVFFDTAINPKTGRVRDSFACPSCNAALRKDELERRRVAAFDSLKNQMIHQALQRPVLINYTLGRRRGSKRPSGDDLKLLEEIDRTTITDFFPTCRIDLDIDLWYERDYHSLGIFSLDAFFTKRNLACLARLHEAISLLPNSSVRLACLFAFTGIVQIASRMSSFRYDARNPKNTAGGILKGTLYIPSLSKEARITDLLKRK